MMTYEVLLTWQYRAHVTERLVKLLRAGWQPAISELPSHLGRVPQKVGAAVASVLPGVHPMDQRWIAYDLAERLEGMEVAS
jgi:hypothetical protein